MMVFAEQTTPPTLPTKELEAVVPAVIENPVPVEAQAGGSAMEVSATDTMCAINFKVINLDTPDLSSNDRDIYEAVLESMLANPVELGVEAPESAAPAPRPQMKQWHPSVGVHVGCHRDGAVFAGPSWRRWRSRALSRIGGSRWCSRGARGRYGVELGRALASDRRGGRDCS
jgi:hypothetical protein